MSSGIGLPRPKTLIGINIALISAFWLFSPEDAPLAWVVALQSARAATSLMVAIIYGYSIWQLAKDREPAQSHGLVLGIWMAFAADLYSSVMGIAWRMQGRPDWQNHAFWLFPTFITALAAVHHIAMPGAVDGRIPRRNIIWVGVAFGIAGLAAGLVIGQQLRPGFFRLL